MRLLSFEEATACWLAQPAERRIATLSPAYVVADARRDAALEPIFIGSLEPGRFWYHGVHRSRVPDGSDHDLQSPYGYGGPVSDIEDARELARLWDDYGAWCADNGVVAEFVRLHPLARTAGYGGLVRDDRACVGIPLEPGDLLARYEVRCRTAVRKAIKAGGVVRAGTREEMVGTFPDFYRAGMRMIGASDFYLFGDAYFEALAEVPGIRLMICERDGEWLSAALFLAAPRVWEYHLSASTDVGRRMSASNLLIDHAANVARDEGAGVLFLGGGTTSAPDNPLLFFKAGFAEPRLRFRIGSQIHRPDRYADLAARHPDRAASGRVLFYRS